MSEKRFTVLKKLENCYIEADVIDTYIERLVKDGKSVGWVTVGILDKGNPITYKDCVDLLNEQHETITDLTENLSVTSNREMRKDFVIERLQKENEELKKDIQDKEEIIELYQGFCGKGDVGMTTKRFVVENYSIRDRSVDTKYINSYYHIGDNGVAKRLCDLLNALHEENVGLKNSLKEFDVFESDRIKGAVVTNDDFSVTLHGNNEAYMVCNMINRFIRSVKNGSED